MPYPAVLTFLRTNNTEVISDALVNKFANNIIGAGYIDIEKQFKPELIKRYENLSSFNTSKCNMVEDCPVYYRALFNLKPTLSIIGNVSPNLQVSSCLTEKMIL